MKKFVLIYVLIFTSLFCYAEKQNFRFGANAFIPPYVIGINPKPKGLMLEIVELVFKKMNIEPEYFLLSNLRINKSFYEDKLDGALFLTDYEAKNKNGKVYESKELIEFKNGFICLKKDYCEAISKPGSKLSLSAFQNAKKYVDRDFYKLIEDHNGKYQEEANQKNQVLALHSGKADVLFMDFRIYRYLKKSLINANHPISKQLKESKVYKKLWPRQAKRLVAFKDKATRDRFNKVLADIKTGEEFKAVISSYTNE